MLCQIFPFQVKAICQILESGKVYTFGDGSNGQLGHNTRVLHSENPHELSFKQKVTHLSCGENHTAIITGKFYIHVYVVVSVIVKYTLINTCN